MTDKISKKEHDNIVKHLHDEILRRDKIIDKLKEENRILIRTSVKRNEELFNIQEKFKKKLS